MATYKVLTGLNYPDSKGGSRRAEIGDTVSDIPETSVPWLLEDGHIELATDAPTKQSRREPAPPPEVPVDPPADPAPAEEVT